jgi:hypothetical protein
MRETGTDQLVAQLLDSYMMMMMTKNLTFSVTCQTITLHTHTHTHTQWESTWLQSKSEYNELAGIMSQDMLGLLQEKLVNQSAY